MSASSPHVDVFIDPGEREIQHAADDVDADVLGATDKRGAVRAAGLSSEDGGLLGAIPVHQSADVALHEGLIVGAHVEEEELRVFAAVGEHDELLEGFLEDAEKHFAVFGRFHLLFEIFEENQHDFVHFIRQRVLAVNRSGGTDLL